MERMQILFPKPQLDRLRRLAGSRDRPVSELVRAAVDAWLERQGEPAKRASPRRSSTAVKSVFRPTDCATRRTTTGPAREEE